MNINEMTLENVSARLSEIEAELETKSGDELIALKDEVKELQERKATLKDLEERKLLADQLQNDKVDSTDVKVVEERKEDRTMMKIEEYRNSKEYVDAYAEYIKTGEDKQLRALLTTNVGEAGEIAVPDFVYDIVKTDWLESGIMALVKKISVQGNMKVQFELTAGDAVIHDEGSGAVSEEELTLGIVSLIPVSIKKWISISDEALDMTGEAFLKYVIDEITHKIAIKAESELIGKIAVNAKKVKAGAALGTIATALGQLNAEATNPVILMNPATKAAFKTAVYSGQFNADPFEGLTVYTTNALPAVGTASENDVYAIVGDFGFGALANFPNGNNVQIKVDDKTAMTSDLVKILGRQFVAVEPIACRAFVNITKPASL